MSLDARDDRVEPALLILKRLSAALRTTRLYGPAHRLTRTALADAAALAARYAGRHGELRVDVTRGGWRFGFDNTERVHDQVAPLLAALRGRGIRELRLTRATTETEIRDLLTVLVLPIETARAPGELRPVAPATAAAILRQFVATARSIRLYGEGHPTVRVAVGDLFAALDVVLPAAGTLAYEVRSGAVFAAGALVDDDSLVAAAFASDCAARQIDSLTFARGLTREELAQTVALFARDPEALVVEGGFPEALRVRQVAHVR